MALKEMPKVGEKVRYIGGEGVINYDVTFGSVYVIMSNRDSAARFIDDTGGEYSVIFEWNFDKFELVTEPHPDVQALLANIGRRLHEVETALAPKEYEEVGPADFAKDAVNPDHYKRGKYETIEIIEHIASGYPDGFIAHCAGTAIKYIARAPFKHATPTEDLRKAARYLEFAIKRLEAGGRPNDDEY